MNLCLTDTYLMETVETIEDLSTSLICKILLNINDTKTFQSARITNKLFYRILKNYKAFSKKNKLTKIVYFKNHKPIKIEHYSYLQHYVLNNCITEYYNYKKNGTSIEHNVFNQIVSKSYYKDNLLDGISKQYHDNKLVESTTFKNDVKHGWQHSWFDNYIQYDKKYIFGSLCKLMKFIKNNMIYKALFKHNILHGLTIVYDRYTGVKKNILNFKYNKLDGLCIVTEFDRILKMQYKFGYLDGAQMVFTKDKELKFVGNYKGGVLHGNYIIFNHSEKKEEGTLDIYGNYNKYIVYNGPDFIKVEYPLTSSKLNGLYIESIGSYTMSLSFKDNQFNGYYLLNDSQTLEQIEIKIYNENNFEYKKIENTKCTVILKKNMGIYTLILYDPTTNDYNIFYLDCFIDTTNIS
jgi:antitoxin component YwqK of YwqJK toxin-antitoxin module